MDAKGFDAAGVGCCCANGDALCAGCANGLGALLFWFALLEANGLAPWFVCPEVDANGLAAGALFAAEAKGLALFLVFADAANGFTFWPSWLG